MFGGGTPLGGGGRGDGLAGGRPSLNQYLIARISTLSEFCRLAAAWWRSADCLTASMYTREELTRSFGEPSVGHFRERGASWTLAITVMNVGNFEGQDFIIHKLYLLVSKRNLINSNNSEIPFVNIHLCNRKFERSVGLSFRSKAYLAVFEP